MWMFLVIFDVQHMWKSLGSSSYLLGTFEKKQNSAFDQAKAGMSSTEMGSSSRDIGVGTIEALVKAAKNILSTLWMAISGCRLAMTSATSGTYNPI